MPIPPGSPVVSVIIPARDAAPTLERTLLALGDQTLAEPFEVIVVDDGSRDETAAIAARHAPLVTLLLNERGGGPGNARNRAVHAARAPVLAFTDADCLLVPRVGVKSPGFAVVGLGWWGGGPWARSRGGVCPRTPRLTSALDLGWLLGGDMMCDGVFRQMWCGRSFFLGRPPRGVGSDFAGSWPRFIG